MRHWRARFLSDHLRLVVHSLVYGGCVAALAGGVYGLWVSVEQRKEFLHASIVGQTISRGDHLNTERQLNDLRQAILSSSLSADEKKRLLTVSSSARPFVFRSIAPYNEARPKDLPFLVNQFLRINKETVAEDKRGMALMAAVTSYTPEQVRAP